MIPARREPRAPGYEPSDVPAGSVARAGAFLFLALGASMGAIALLLTAIAPARAPLSAAQAERRFTSPSPPLEVAPRQARQRLEARERKRLREAPRPIDAAMRDTARRGWGEDAAAPSIAETASRHAEETQ